MNLCIDIGNTNIKIAYYKNNILQQSYCEPSEAIFSADNNIFLKYKLETIKNIIISSVVPEILEKVKDRAKNDLGIEPVIVDAGFNFGFNVEYDLAQIGIDRLIAMFGAKKKLNKKNILLIDFGTAVTIDLLKQDVFKGGIIFPGMNLCFKSLAETSELPEIEFEKSENLLGLNTKTAINAGVFYGICGLVDFYINKFNNLEDICVVATGGYCDLFSKEIKFNSIDKNLVLDGLNFCAV
jgi:type III pantothenate kinase